VNPLTKEREGARFARNALSSYGARGLYAVALLVLTPYLYSGLGAGGFGTWSVMFTFTMVFNLVFTGFSAGLVKVLADLNARDRQDDFAGAVGASMMLLGVLGVAAAGISLVAGFLLAGLAADGLEDDFRAGMAVLGAAMLVAFPTWVYAAAAQSLQRYDLFGAGMTASTVLFAAGCVAAIEGGAGLVGVAVAYGASLVAGSVIRGVLLRRATGLPLIPRRRSMRGAGGLWRFGTLVLVADSMTFIGQRMDTVIIAAVRDAATAAPQAAAVRLQSGLQTFTLPLIDLLLPMVADLRSRDRHEELRRRFTLATRVALQITLPLAFGLAVFAHDAVDAWLGDDVPSVAASIVIVLVSIQVVGLTSAPAEKILIGVGRARTVARLSVVEATANVALSIWLVSREGAIGAALGSLFTSALIGPLKVPLATRATGLPLGRLLRDGVLVPVVSSLPALAAMTAVFALMDQGALRLAIGLALGVALAVAAAVAQIGPSKLGAAWRTLRPASAQPALAVQPDDPFEVALAELAPPDPLRNTMNLAAMSPQRRARSRLRRIAPADRRRVSNDARSAQRRSGLPWLSETIGLLAARDPVSAGRLLVALLPDAARTLEGDLVYDVDVEGVGEFRVSATGGKGSVVMRHGGMNGGAAVRVSGPVARLAPLGAGGAAWRLGGVRVRGSRRALGRLVRARRAPVDLGDLAAAGIVPDPALLLSALAAGVRPSWVRRELAVAVDVPGHEPITLVAEPGRGLAVEGAPPSGGAVRAVLQTSPAALLALLGRVESREGDDAMLTGEDDAMAELLELLDRAQGFPACA
jgi:O-antigen/teichoic acid export membrane protein